ncbi:hypothetical protein H310_15171 [Aphanomyces invadans]|uniref:Uncharacterized protein n=1 Tax=Aphanomyces invadans TaxID=157072 RepID=A0A024T7Y9_9STRA|nr:hypothetical protein H310_15171 [Aphanomyces invadans]ETV89989.1 hypothetical protein H310_15171 [Aphanomyces invadans]|eukprot:XP_008881380.1 hypothetical protein H310_15171 [Aphanomyces invadans]
MPQPIHHHQESMLDSQIQWDREQARRIHDTLSCTIAELHNELHAKEVEIESLRASVQREKAKQREIEEMTASLEAQNCQDKDQLSKVTQGLRDMTLSHANEMEKLHAAQDTINEERAVKDALQHRSHNELPRLGNELAWRRASAHREASQKMVNALRHSLHLAKPSCTPPTTQPHGIVKRRVHLSPRKHVHSSTSRHNMNVFGAPTDAVRPLRDL